MCPRMTVWLSTAPSEPLTHWYQVRCLLPSPLIVAGGQILAGQVHLVSNRRQLTLFHAQELKFKFDLVVGRAMRLKLILVWKELVWFLPILWT
jgi:hypothetical protein